MRGRHHSEETIELNNKKVQVDKLIDAFVVIPSTEIVQYLKNKEIYLPSYIHKALLRKNIAPTIANGENDDKFSDEMKHRLKWFDEFTIFQLERLAESYGISVDVKEYKKDLWYLIIHNRNELGVSNLEFVRLQNLTMKYQRTATESYETMRDNFKAIYFEPQGYFEGCREETAKQVLHHATTLTDVRDLGKKHGVEIPRRINKKQLIEIIALKLDLNDAEQDELQKKSIIELETHAKKKNINVSIELKKIDMIEFILLKRKPLNVPIQEENARLFEGIDIEEYLFDTKFEEIAHRYTVERKRRRRMIRNILVSLVIILVAVLVVLFDLF